MATEVPGARVHAVELDPAALAWAARNVRRLDGVDLRLGDMADAFPELDGTVDVVVSNPPYIPLGRRDPRPRGRRPRPGRSRCGPAPTGWTPCAVVERVAARLLRPGGLLVVEHADLQGASAPAVFDGAGGWPDVADHRDLAGRDRYVTAVRRGATMAADGSSVGG